MLSVSLLSVVSFLFTLSWLPSPNAGCLCCILFGRAVLEQSDHFECRLGTLAALVAHVPPRTVDCLLHRFARKNAKEDGQVQSEREFHKSQTHALVEVFVVRSLAANDRPQADDTCVFICLRKPLSNDRNFPRTRNPRNIDLRLFDPSCLQRFQGSFEKLGGDRTVPFGDNNRKTIVGVERRGGECICQGIAIGNGSGGRLFFFDTHQELGVRLGFTQPIGQKLHGIGGIHLR